MLAARIDKMSIIHENNILFDLCTLWGKIKMAKSNTYSEIVHERMHNIKNSSQKVQEMPSVNHKPLEMVQRA